MRSLLCAVALALTAGAVFVAMDAARRAATLSTLTRGMGTPDNPSQEDVRSAEWNLAYLLGLALGTASGLTSAAAAGLWWRLARTRRPAAVPAAAPLPARNIGPGCS